MVCVSCLKAKEPEGCYVCDKCYKAATGIDRNTGKVDFNYSKDFKNPYAVKIEEKPKKSRKRAILTTTTEYGRMKEESNDNLLREKCDCSDLTLSHNKPSRKVLGVNNSGSENVEFSK